MAGEKHVLRINPGRSDRKIDLIRLVSCPDIWARDYSLDCIGVVEIDMGGKGGLGRNLTTFLTKVHIHL